MVHRPLGATGLHVSAIGFGAFKIGRNVGIKYAHAYELPDDDAVVRLLHGAIDLGINYFDTAPAYGSSEERLGSVLGQRDDIVISTKVGESFHDGRSHFDFSRKAILESIDRSRKRLRRDALDLVFIHSDGDDAQILHQTDAVVTLRELRERGGRRGRGGTGAIRAIGFSGKTVSGARAALDWADAIMVEYHVNDRSHEAVIAEAAARGVGVVIKKGLASGRLDPRDAIPFVLQRPGVSSMVIGGLNLDHLRDNVAVAEHACGRE